MEANPSSTVMPTQEASSKDSTKTESDEGDLSLADILNIKVVTASNREETLRKVPATMIVVTDTEIKERGYTELYDVLNDLPGFDLSRAFGDDYVYVSTRGYRKTLSDQMLLMIDGIIMNHLWSNNMNLATQYPLAGVKQIEVVYGPASAVYGANAFAGVINIITKTEGTSATLTAGQNNTVIGDFYLNQTTASDIKVHLMVGVIRAMVPTSRTRHLPWQGRFTRMAISGGHLRVQNTPAGMTRKIISFWTAVSPIRMLRLDLSIGRLHPDTGLNIPQTAF